MLTDNDKYQNEGFFNQLMHSCAGRLIIVGAVIGIILLIAAFTIPSEETMTKKVNRAIAICLTENNNADKLDEAFRNATMIFDDESDSTKVDRVLMNFVNKYNKVKVEKHTFSAEAVIYNAQFPTGKSIAIGLFGMVIPTINNGDLLKDFGVMRKEIGQKILELRLESGPTVPELNSVGLTADSANVR